MTAKPHILIIDNYDSFVHNLARFIRNDEHSVEDITTSNYDGIILSPGPKAPIDAGICIELIKALGANLPILGVCLGHQAIAQCYGGRVEQTEYRAHGMARTISHDNSGLFTGIPSPFEGGLYHSLSVDISGSPDLTITASDESTGVIMGIAHKKHPVYGIQFHPESILTTEGQKLVQNFFDIVLDSKT